VSEFLGPRAAKTGEYVLQAGTVPVVFLLHMEKFSSPPSFWLSDLLREAYLFIRLGLEKGGLV
jgi:hypothetical protein